jgi:DNA polymerase-3 subunit alpha
MNLFAVGQSEEKQSEAVEVELPADIEEWPNLERLAAEKETVGFFLTGHPLEGVMEDLQRSIDTDIEGVEKLSEDQMVRIGGLIASYKEHKSKKGDRMAFTTLEDMTGKIEVIVFPSTFAECSELLLTDQPLVVLGTVQQGERGAKIIAQEVRTLSNALEKYTDRAIITLRATHTSRQHMLELKELLYQHHGMTPVMLTLHFDNRGEVDIQVLKDMSVRPSSELFHKITDLCGPRSLQVLMRQPEVRQRGNGRRRGKPSN